ncbi:MAG: hypothetical protein U9Q72_03240 [Patescibacteria group bacterium]|nr:hypothetical protein [Patescibacteria group bacterium]
MENIDKDSEKLLKEYLDTRQIELEHEMTVIKNITDPAKLIARLERTSEELQWMIAGEFTAGVNRIDNFYELIDLWKRSEGKKYGQIDFRDFIEKEMVIVLNIKTDEGIDIGEVLQYLGRAPICSNPQKIILEHLKEMLEGNIHLIKEVIRGKLKLPHSLKDFFVQEVGKALLE